MAVFPHLAALPEVAASARVSGGLSSAVPGLGLDLGGVALSLVAAGAAGDEDDDGGQEGGNGGSENAPHGGAVVSSGVAAVGVPDAVAEEAEGDKVADHGDEGDDEGQSRDEGGDEGANHVGAEGQEEGDEAQDSGDGVEDHDIGEAVDGGAADVGHVDAIAADHLERNEGVVANVGVAAVIVAGVYR
jgi:hypothetical protein